VPFVPIYQSVQTLTHSLIIDRDGGLLEQASGGFVSGESSVEVIFQRMGGREQGGRLCGEGVSL
jgi:hypothetical protein